MNASFTHLARKTKLHVALNHARALLPQQHQAIGQNFICHSTLRASFLGFFDAFYCMRR
jgi:hypothetical protein